MEIFLSSVEVRVLGALIEKELTTPEYYPLTLNSLVNACNQKSNRDPVVNYDDSVVEKALGTLRDRQYARRVTGSEMRVPKYKQIFSEEMKFSPEETAVICVLMLRGAQTIGEIKGRTGRMSNFESLLQVEEVINKLSIREKPLVMKLSRQAGMKELRYAHLLSGEPVYQSEPEPLENEIEEDKRLLKLEQELSVLHADLDQLKTQFNELKKLLE
jgi:uncharacterized protein YceH (UPF0502 family)